MTIGKREQIVIGSILALVLIAILHLVIFSPSARRYKESKTSWDAVVQQVQGLQTVSNPQMLTNFDRDTGSFLTTLNQGMEELRLDQPEAFAPPPDPATVEVAADPGTDPAVIDQMKQAEISRIMDARKTSQTMMLLNEMGQLQTFGRNPGSLQLAFLGQSGWNLPLELPAAMQTGQLWDMIKNISEVKDTLSNLGQNTPAYAQMRVQYERLLAQIGFNMRHYERLSRFGEFVPLYYKLAFANLIYVQMRQSTSPIIIQLRELTLPRVLDLLEVNIPFDPLPAESAEKPAVPETKSYFAYQNLKNLNELIRVAQQPTPENVAAGTMVISEVSYPAYGFLREQAELSAPDTNFVDPVQLPGDEETMRAPSAAGAMVGDPGMEGTMVDPYMYGIPGGGEGMPGEMPGDMGDPGAGGMGTAVAPGMMGAYMPGGGVMGGAPGSNASPLKSFTQQPDEVGFALPIKITFLADNTRSWWYIYEVLRERPLVELNRLVMNSLSRTDPNNNNLQVAATYVFVPKLFDTLDAVRRLLEELQQQPAGEGAPADAMAPTDAAALPGAVPGPPQVPIPGAPMP